MAHKFEGSGCHPHNSPFDCRQPGIRIEIISNNVQSADDTDRTLHEKTDRQPAVRLERYMKFGTASRRSGYTQLHIGPLFKNRKQNITCYDMVVVYIECTIKTLQYVYLGFSMGGRGRREIIFRM